MAGQVTLFLGGARSGKSRLAQAAAEALPGELVYVATAEAGDEEMAARIARHRADRGSRWRTVECPLDLAGAIRAAQGGAVLVDCLTLWLTNVMLSGSGVETACAGLLSAIGEARAPLLLVSNEVGLGIVPETALGRDFRDAAGRLNQAVAAAADHVRFVAAGLAMTLK